MTVHNLVHNTAQNSSDNLVSYLQTSIVAQMLSIGGKRGVEIVGQYYILRRCTRAVAQLF